MYIFKVYSLMGFDIRVYWETITIVKIMKYPSPSRFPSVPFLLVPPFRWGFCQHHSIETAGQGHQFSPRCWIEWSILSPYLTWPLQHADLFIFSFHVDIFSSLGFQDIITNWFSSPFHYPLTLKSLRTQSMVPLSSLSTCTSFIILNQ